MLRFVIICYLKLSRRTACRSGHLAVYLLVCLFYSEYIELSFLLESYEDRKHLATLCLKKRTNFETV